MRGDSDDSDALGNVTVAACISGDGDLYVPFDDDAEHDHWTGDEIVPAVRRKPADKEN
jgi:hypothetical protein